METIETLGKYEIRRTLGRGAMGVVYEGWDPIIARRVAIKTVKIPDAEDPETEDQLARFRREAQAAGRLIHPNIIGVFDYGEANGVAYIVMEFVDGPSVKSLLDKQERFATPEILRLMEDLLTGLQFSHERGVVHRDIKPANLMLTSEGQAKIADFGIARIESSSMTQAGTVLGTPAYMSPEQFMGQVVDARSDIYSSGVLLYQLLTGERPFEGGLSAIMHKALNTEPPAPSQISVTCSPAFDAVVRKAMAKRPEDRFQSATEFLQALRAAASGPRTIEAVEESTMVVSPQVAGLPPTPAPVAAPSPAVAEPKPKPSRLSLILTAITVLVLLAGGGGWYFLSHRPAPSKQAAAPSMPGSPGSASPTGNRVTAAAAASAGGQVAPGTPAAGAESGEAAGTGARRAAVPTPAAAAESAAPAGPAAPTATAAPISPANPSQQAAAPSAPSNPSTPTVAQPAASTPTAPSPQQLAAVGLGSLRQQIQSIVASQPCSALDSAVQDSGDVTLSGLAGRSAAEAVKQAVTGVPGAAGVNWQVTSVDPYYCPALDVIHPIFAGPAGMHLGLSLADGVTKLHDGAHILPRIVMPGFRGYLRVDYVTHDGDVVHLYPQVADPTNKISADPSHSFAPQQTVQLGEPSPGHPVWEVGEPYGKDMIIAIASSQPLFDRSRPGNMEHASDYLAALQAAVDSARQRGVRLAGSALVLDTLPK